MAISPIRDTTDEARDLAKRLLRGATFAALAVVDETGAPQVSRIALTATSEGQPLSLVSDLSAHTRALQADGRCALLVGEPQDRGDPLTHPRLTLTCVAERIDRAHPHYAELRCRCLENLPKSKLYIDFADFNLVRFRVLAGALNGGFGKAFNLAPIDLL